MPRRAPVSIGLEPLPHSPSNQSLSDDSLDVPRKPWHHYLPVCATFILILAPHPSLLYVLVDFHLLTLHKPWVFATHLIATYTLTFMILSSFIVCIVRNPGPVMSGGDGQDTGEVGVTEMLMSEDFSAPGKWCRKCWAPKPQRTHHCSTCGQCVLKMDHHCPWIGSCIGHRTYPAFLHFLGSITTLALYLAALSISALVYAFNNPYDVNNNTPLHELMLAAVGIIITLVVGPFFCYHLYLVSTNQTTIEHISPFLLLKHLPQLPATGHNLSDPPLEQELSSPQRRLVKDAHHSIRLYDVGWRKNWAQVLGFDKYSNWRTRLWYGDTSPGDGRRFTLNPGAEDMLATLAKELVNVDRN